MSTEPLSAALRRLRLARGLSLADLGRLVSYSRKTIWDYEQGRRTPHPEAVAALDDALAASGQLVELHARTVAAQQDGPDRVAAGLAGRARPDAAMHDHLAAILASQRAIEDTAGARLVIPATLQQLDMVEALRRDAGADTHAALVALESQYAQFIGWCYQDLGDEVAAERWYARALLAAHEAGDDNMVASVLSMRSNAAWDAGDARRAAALGDAATRPGGATPGVLALSHQQAARAYARLGDRRAAEHALDAAARLAQAAGRHPDREPPWTYFFDEDRFAIQRALVLRELGDHRAAADLFRQAVDKLPPAFQRDRAVYLGRLAVALARGGELGEARTVAAEGRRLAETTGSTRALTELNEADKIAGAVRR